eukprot:359352-Chlamydomonas_euryale.AAC.1
MGRAQRAAGRWRQQRRPACVRVWKGAGLFGLVEGRDERGEGPGKGRVHRKLKMLTRQRREGRGGGRRAKHRTCTRCAWGGRVRLRGVAHGEGGSGMERMGSMACTRRGRGGLRRQVCAVGRADKQSPPCTRPCRQAGAAMQSAMQTSSCRHAVGHADKQVPPCSRPCRQADAAMHSAVQTSRPCRQAVGQAVGRADKQAVQTSSWPSSRPCRQAGRADKQLAKQSAMQTSSWPSSRPCRQVGRADKQLAKQSA